MEDGRLLVVGALAGLALVGRVAAGSRSTSLRWTSNEGGEVWWISRTLSGTWKLSNWDGEGWQISTGTYLGMADPEKKYETLAEAKRVANQMIRDAESRG